MRPELMPPDDPGPGAVHALQDRLLREHVARLADRSPFYRRRFQELGLRPGDITGRADLHRLPFTRNIDLEHHGAELLCVDRRAVIDHVTTSGTTGKPVTLLLDEPDLERLAANERNAFRMAGVTADDTVQVMTTLDRRFMAGLAYFMGARALGAGVVRTGPGAAALQWDSIHRFGTTVLVAVPGFLLKLIEHARTHGIDPARSTVRKALCIGEPVHAPGGGPSNLARRIKESWGIELLGTYASTEMATACTETHEGSGHAVQPQLMLAEVLDDQDRPVAHGQAGEVVVTPFHVSAMPLLRYRTGDICVRYEGAMDGRGTGLHLGPVIGRRQQRLKVRGTTLYPAQVLDAVHAMPTIPTFVVVCTTNDLGGDELEVWADLEGGALDALREHLRACLRVAPRITARPTADIEKLKWPKDSRKPQLFIDRRTHRPDLP